MGIEIIGKLTQKNNGDFKLVDLADVDYDGTGKSAKQELENLSSQIKDKADKTTTNNIQQQVNNLVLGAVGDGNNAEVIQSRGFYDLLNTRLDIIQTGISDLINKKYNWDWIIGFVDGSTGNVESSKYRMCTKDIIYAKDDIIISLNDYSLYRYGVVEYSDEENTLQADTGWLTRDYVIKKGTYFRITIAKLSEDEEITNRFFNKLLDNINIYYLYEFKDVYSRIRALEKQYMSNNIHSLDYYPLTFGNINGNDGIIANHENRVITTTYIYLKKGVKIICNNDFLCGVASYDNDYNFIGKTEDIPKYTIPADGYYILIFYKKNYTYETNDKMKEIIANCFIIGENYKKSDDGNNAEVIQSRGFYDLLNTRLDIIQTGISDLINKKYNWDWIIGFVDGSTGNVESSKYRVCMKDITYTEDDIIISLNDYSLYKYGVVEYSDEENTSRKDTGWLTRDYVIKKGTYFRITIAKLSEDEEITNRFFNKLLDNINIYYLYEFKDVYSRIRALEKQYMSNNIHSLDYYPLTFGNINGNDGIIANHENRVITTTYIYLRKGCKLICNNDFLCGVASYDDNYNYIGKVEEIPTYTIPKDGYYILIFYKKNYSYETTDKMNEIKNNCFIAGENYYTDNTDNTDNYDLNYYGEEINLKPHAFKCEKLFDMNNTSSTQPPSGQGTQGIAISNNVLFQLWGNGFVELYDFLTGEFINAYNITSEHGDCAQFGNTKYSEDDEFPLLYVTSDTTPAKIYINRVTRTSSELVKTLLFPIDKTGYYSGQAIDFEKNIVYQIGYKNNTYHINDGTNKMIVSSWDLNELTDNGNNTYTPRYIKSFELPFLITVQGQKFYDGKIYAVSSHWENTNTVIYGIDTVNERICTIIKDFPSSIKDCETEDLEFWYDTNEGDYKIILSVREKAIYKLSFK